MDQEDVYRFLQSISIHAPREGSDYALICNEFFRDEFQSTLPVRGATSTGNDYTLPTGISIHAPREGSDHNALSQAYYTSKISIHAPREGSDDKALCPICRKSSFQSTLPVRGATAKIHKKGYVFSAKNIIFTADSCFRMIQLNENVRYLTQSAVKIGANLLENSVCFQFAD